MARIDAQRLFASEGVQRHMREHSDDKRDARLVEGLASFVKDARLDVVNDVKEVVLCLADSPGSGGGITRRAKYLVVVGGKLQQSDVASSILKHAPAGRAFKKRDATGKGSGKELLERGGIFLAQADDGAILLSDSETLLIAAWSGGQPHHKAMKLPAAPVAAVANREVLASLGPMATGQNPFAQALSITQRLQLTLELAPVNVSALLDAASDADAKKMRDQWEQVLAPFRNPATLAQLRERLPAVFLAMLKSTQTAIEGKQVRVQFQLPPTALESLYHSASVLAATKK